MRAAFAALNSPMVEELNGKFVKVSIEVSVMRR